ncbi:MAG TPA: NAD(P)/FAD-dependent oxidoreductase [Anaerolineaceae bacterium]
MDKTEVIIVGGGPAGAACAWKLGQQQVDFRLLDKAVFPRIKPCAGWITPQVLRDLEMDAGDYPHSFTHFSSFQVFIKDFRVKLRTNQYAIRRFEFDDWLLGRSKSNYVNHTVKSIVFENGQYCIDGEFSAKYLIGAGGTHCPVGHTLFQSGPEGKKGSLIVAQEEEFAYDYSDERCFLWFFQNGLPGYAWYVPKANGFVNVGVGGSAAALKAKNDTLKRHWGLLVEKLDDMGLIRGRAYKPVGHSYFLSGKHPALRKGNAFLIGDAAGLATLDMGEGISPAIQSGLRAAEAIVSGQDYSVASLHKYSFPSLLGFR